MLYGAILGGIVGLIVAIVMAKKRSGQSKKVYAAFVSGGASEARVVLDAWVPPVAGEVKIQKIPETLERMAALAVVGDLAALSQETQAVSGKATAVAQVRAMGWVGLITQSDDVADAVEGLKATSEAIHQEGGALLKLVKNNCANMLAVASEIVGGEPAPDARNKLASYAGQMGPFTKPVLYAFLAKGARAAQDKPMADRFHARAAAATAKLKG